jgi:chromate transport protein ChrA
MSGNAKITLLNLYLIFVKIGAILLGGGYVILPIVTSEFAEKRDLVTAEEIVDFFAISQSLPGIIAANISMFIGYKLRGKLGALLAMFGVITVPFLCIISLASLLILSQIKMYAIKDFRLFCSLTNASTLFSFDNSFNSSLYLLILFKINSGAPIK